MCISEIESITIEEDIQLRIAIYKRLGKIKNSLNESIEYDNFNKWIKNYSSYIVPMEKLVVGNKYVPLTIHSYPEAKLVIGNSTELSAEYLGPDEDQETLVFNTNTGKNEFFPYSMHFEDEGKIRDAFIFPNTKSRDKFLLNMKVRYGDWSIDIKLKK